MPHDDINKHRAIINIFVHSIYLYDDHFTLIINASKRPISIENIPLDDIEAAFEGENTNMEGCSSATNPVPPVSHTFCDIVQDKPHRVSYPMWLIALLGVGEKGMGKLVENGKVAEKVRGDSYRFFVVTR